MADSGTGAFEVGETLEVSVRAMAHGGEGIADAPDGRVVFVRGAIPGDRVEARPTKVKKRWARADLVEVLEPSPQRTRQVCQAAAHGAGCCDFGFVTAPAQRELKREVLVGQLRTLAKRSGVLDGFQADSDLQETALAPDHGWRTRARLGVDSEGRAGLRKLRSTELVTEFPCAQMVPGLLDGLVGPGGRRFTPGAEVIAVIDSTGARHVVETAKVQRGRRAETIDTVIEGTGMVTERVDDREFTFPATAFWQAHTAAPQAYADIVAQWGEAAKAPGAVGWDLYGGVGMFAPAISRALGGGRVETVDYSPAATGTPQPGLADLDVRVRNARVEVSVDKLPSPALVVLDPPRSGAGAEVVGAVAQAAPPRVIHIGCDPATLARDLGTWGEHGYRVERMMLIDAFPLTHHFETVVLLTPRA
ncbi:class I SAM-dependent RNA methyltransferase [Corynebacterium hadale]|uniref:class I SAM-dependent RNA methyltransferase n=1 Tax=Corynebacterium hadale TaxID=2026255 RepID=UPI000BAA7553|nr:TRAM domain-containing protein [Corynebacterium hadale]PAT13297.1 RNA methyltransferase [Corynebacterium hadale]